MIKVVEGKNAGGSKHEEGTVEDRWRGTEQITGTHEVVKVAEGSSAESVTGTATQRIMPAGTGAEYI